MFGLRLVVIACALGACSGLAQQNAKSSLDVVVTDQTGAAIPGARVAAVNSATGTRVESRTDGSGEAVLPLDQGTYELSAGAAGFKGWLEKGLGVNGETHRAVTLLIANSISGPVVAAECEMPEEHAAVVAEVPLAGMELFNMLPKRLHGRMRWF